MGVRSGEDAEAGDHHRDPDDHADGCLAQRDAEPEQQPSEDGSGMNVPGAYHLGAVVGSRRLALLLLCTENGGRWSMFH